MRVQNYLQNQQHFRGKGLVEGPQKELTLIADKLYKKSLENNHSFWMAPLNGRTNNQKVEDTAVILTGPDADLVDVVVSRVLEWGGIPGEESFATKIRDFLFLSKPPQKTENMLKEIEDPSFDFLTLNTKK